MLKINGSPVKRGACTEKWIAKYLKMRYCQKTSLYAFETGLNLFMERGGEYDQNNCQGSEHYFDNFGRNTIL